MFSSERAFVAFRPGRRNRFKPVWFVPALTVLVLFTGCGGGSSPPPPPVTRVTSTGLQIQNSSLVVTTQSIEISFKGATVQSMRNLLTGEKHISAPGPGLMDLNLQDPTGELLQPGNWNLQTDPATGATVGKLSLTDSQRQVTMTVGWDSGTDEVIVRLEGRAARLGVRGLVWGIQGFDPAGRFLLPAHGGVYFDAQSPSPNFTFAYPTHWEAQFAIYQSAAGGVLLYARDSKPYFKQIQGSHEFGTFDIILETFALGPWSGASEVPELEWRLKAFQGSWRGAVDVYRAWSSTVFPSRAPDTRRDWARRVRVVLTVADPDPSYLDGLAQLFDPAKTLIYLVNWRTSVLDANYPDYTPTAQVGPFIQHAHQLGFRVMLHTNAVGVATYNPAYASLSQFQLRDPETAQPLYWPWGLWPAGSPPPPFLQSYAFISPASSAYRSLFVGAMQSLMQTVQPDALHIDAGGIMLDDGNGLVEGMTSIDGMIQLHRDITSKFPQLVLGYEGMTETVAGFHGFAQRWSADFPAHPISTYLMGANVKFYGFLNQPNPDEAGFVEYLRHYEAQGVMPTITFDNAKSDNPLFHIADLSVSQPITSRVMQVMKVWQQYDFQPDWQGDWTGLLFRYVSADGTTVATVQDSGDIVQLSAAGKTIYQRVHSSNSIASSSFIANWTAYDSSTLFGLNPTSEYWLRSDIPRPADSLRLADLPRGVQIEAGTLDAGDYGYFELDNVAQPAYDFVLSFATAKIGIAGANGLDFRLAFGALAQVTQTLVGGKLRAPVIVMQPPAGPMLGGATFAEYNVQVPASQSFLNFSAGLSDFGTRSDGVLMKVTINGTQVWNQAVTLGQWVDAQVDLQPWAGTAAKIRFLALPGVNLNPVDDLATWGDLNISTKPTSSASFSVLLPSQSPNPSASSGVQLTATGDPTHYLATAALPARFALFAKQPQPINLGQSLVGMPFTVWKKSYSGFAFPFRVAESGSIRAVTSGGVVKSPALGVYPPERGFSLVTWSVQVPLDASQLAFSICLADPPAPLTSVGYTGVGLSVLINGQSVWDKSIQTNGWTDYSVDLSQWRGQNVVITLQADSQGSALYDWPNWAGLTIL